MMRISDITYSGIKIWVTKSGVCLLANQEMDNTTNSQLNAFHSNDIARVLTHNGMLSSDHDEEYDQDEEEDGEGEGDNDGEEEGEEEGEGDNEESGNRREWWWQSQFDFDGESLIWFWFESNIDVSIRLIIPLFLKDPNMILNQIGVYRFLLQAPSSQYAPLHHMLFDLDLSIEIPNHLPDPSPELIFAWWKFKPKCSSGYVNVIF